MNINVTADESKLAAADVAAVIYEAMRWERKESTPAWQDGNSLAEGRARMAAAEIVAMLFGDRPASPVHDAAPAATATTAGMMGCKPDSPGTGETKGPILSWEQADQIIQDQQAEIARLRNALSSIRSLCVPLDSAIDKAIVCTCDYGLGCSSSRGER